MSLLQGRPDVLVPPLKLHFHQVDQEDHLHFHYRIMKPQLGLFLKPLDGQYKKHEVKPFLHSDFLFSNLFLDLKQFSLLHSNQVPLNRLG